MLYMSSDSIEGLKYIYRHMGDRWFLHRQVRDSVSVSVLKKMDFDGLLTKERAYKFFPELNQRKNTHAWRLSPLAFAVLDKKGWR